MLRERAARVLVRDDREASARRTYGGYKPYKRFIATRFSTADRFFGRPRQNAVKPLSLIGALHINSIASHRNRNACFARCSVQFDTGSLITGAAFPHREAVRV